jgi:hypothetical protein
MMVDAAPAFHSADWHCDELVALQKTIATKSAYRMIASNKRYHYPTDACVPVGAG